MAWLVSTFADNETAADVAPELEAFFAEHAGQKDAQREDPYSITEPTPARLLLDSRYDIGSSAPPLRWGDVLYQPMLSDELPAVAAIDKQVVVFVEASPLDFVADYLEARGGNVERFDATPSLSVVCRIAEGPAGERAVVDLTRLFNAAAPSRKAPWHRADSLTDWAPRPDELLWFFDGDTALLDVPLEIEALGDIDHYFGGDAFSSRRIRIGDLRMHALLRSLISFKSCHECGRSPVKFAPADGAMPEDQLICETCGGMFDLQVVADNAPMQHVCDARLKRPRVHRGEVLAVSLDGDVWRRGRPWTKLAGKHTRLVSLLSAGDTLLVGGMPGYIARSVDGGDRWTQPKCPLRGWIYDFARAPSGTLLACGRGIARSDDDGQTWTQGLRTSAELLCIDCASDDVVLGGNRFGQVWRTTNGGRKWKLHKTPVESALNGIVALSESRAVAVGDGGVILVSDNGRRWRRVQTQTLADIEDITSSADGRLHAIASNGTILSSVDGETWHRRSLDTRVPMWGLIETSSGTLVCVGDQGAVIEVRA